MSVGSGTEGRIVATLLLLLPPPMVSAALAALVRPYRRVVGWANAILALVSVGSALALWREVLVGRVVTSGDRKSTRLNSSHLVISYAVFCLKKKRKEYTSIRTKRRTHNT